MRLKTNKYIIYIIFKFFSENAGFTEAQTFKGHTNYVVSITMLVKSDILPSGLIITGGNDKLLCGFIPESPEPVFVETRHTNTGIKNIVYFFLGIYLL